MDTHFVVWYWYNRFIKLRFKSYSNAERFFNECTDYEASRMIISEARVIKKEVCIFKDVKLYQLENFFKDTNDSEEYESKFGHANEYRF